MALDRRAPKGYRKAWNGGVPPVTGLDVIAEERARQVSVEGWTPEHDDGHDSGELAMAAACYAAPDLIYVEERHVNSVGFIDPWPWDEADDKRPRDGNVIVPSHRASPANRIRLLAKAGALIAAEIDRLQRVVERHEAAKCSATNPCCDRRDEYNGYGSDGPRLFTCPKHCGCHD